MVIAALAILFAQVQCASACTIQSCTTKVPPCHRQHQSPCHEDAGVTTAATAIMAVPMPMVSAWDIAPIAPLAAAEHAGNSAFATDASPPGGEHPSILVLRI